MFTGYHVPEHNVTSDNTGIKPGSTIFDTLQDRGYSTGVFSENPYLTSIKNGLESGFDTIEGSTHGLPFDAVEPGEYNGDPLGFLDAAVRSGKPLRSIANGLISKIAWDYPVLIPEQFERLVGPGVVHGSTYTDLFCEYLKDVSGPWAACINYMDAHHPYKPQPECSLWDDGSIHSIQESLDSIPMSFYSGHDLWWKCEVLEYLYDGSIRQIDQEIGRVTNLLKEKNSFDNTMIIITSDHGEAFGENSVIRNTRLAGHNIGENEINLHVPLLIKYPGQQNSRTIDKLVTLTSIPDTIKQVIDNRHHFETLTDKTVVAQTTGLRDVQLEQLMNQGADEEAYHQPANVLYRAENEAISKQILWKDRDATVKCISSEISYKIESSKLERIRKTFNNFNDANIRSDNNGDEIDERLEQHLEDLGYR